MLKQRMIKVVVGLALLVTTIGASGIVVDLLGHSMALQALASSAGSSGGGC